MGLGRPSCLRYSDWHTCRDRVPSLLGSLLGMRTGHCIWLFEDTSKDAPPFHRVLLPYAEQPASFLNNPFYLLDTPVHLWCTFFSNSCELMSKKSERTHAPALCGVWQGPWTKAVGFAGPPRPLYRALGAAVLPSCRRCDPSMVVLFSFLPVKPVGSQKI